MAAAAVILIGMSSCKKNENNAETQNQPVIENPSDPKEVDEAVAEYLDQLSPVDSTAKRTRTLTTTPTGLKYRVVKEGTGKQPTADDEVEVNYEGRLLSGEVFDSSYKRGEPAKFPLKGVIPGWTEGLQYMKEGAVYEFYIPYDIAYGPQGRGEIPPKADLLFKVELIKVN